MKLRFKLVIVLVCLSLLTAFALQGYWLYQSFETENKRIDAEIVDAMEKADVWLSAWGTNNTSLIEDVCPIPVCPKAQKSGMISFDQLASMF